MKNPSGTERGRFVIQGSALSFKGCAHPLENASEANQRLLTIRVNCSEDGLTSAPRPGASSVEVSCSHCAPSLPASFAFGHFCFEQ